MDQATHPLPTTRPIQPQPKHRHTTHTHPVPTGLVKPKPNPSTYSPHSSYPAPSQTPPPHISSSEEILLPSSNHTYTKSTPNHIHHHYAPSVTPTHMTHTISSSATTYAPHCHPWICGQTLLDYHRTTNTTQAHRPSSKSERYFIILQFNINGLKNKLEEHKLLIHDTLRTCTQNKQMSHTTLIFKQNRRRQTPITTMPSLQIGTTHNTLVQLHQHNHTSKGHGFVDSSRGGGVPAGRMEGPPVDQRARMQARWGDTIGRYA